MLNHVLRAMLATALLFGVSNLAVAQYGGGGGMGGGMPGSPTYTPHGSYSNKGAIIGGVVGGAAVIGGLLYWKHHNRAKLQAAWRAVETNLSMRKTTKPTASATRRMRP